MHENRLYRYEELLSVDRETKGCCRSARVHFNRALFVRQQRWGRDDRGKFAALADTRFLLLARAKIVRLSL